MRYQIICLLFLVIFFGCKKDPVSEDTGNTPSTDYTAIPKTETVSADIMVYTPGNYQQRSPIRVLTDGVYYTYQDKFYGFLSPTLHTDKYFTTCQAEFQLTADDDGYDNYRVLPPVSNVKNYADIQLLNATSAGFVQVGNSAEMTLPGGGRLSLPAYAFSKPYSTGGYEILARYLDPTEAEFAVSMPSAFADEKGKRWFLQSYGAYFMQVYATDYSGPNNNFDPAVPSMLRMPISASLASGAPDSIPVWNLVNNKWYRQVRYAKKVNSNYETVVDRKGFWNFAIPVDAVYVTLQLRTQNNIPVVNTRLRFKSAGNEVADARTDDDGNATVLLPSRQPITMDVDNDHYGGWLSNSNAKNQMLGTFTKATDKVFTLADRFGLVTIEGDVFTCDGSRFGNGSVLLSNENAKADYTSKIVDGHFAISSWINYAYNHPTIDILDNTGKKVSTSVVGVGNISSGTATPLTRNRIQVYTCSDAPNLYANYQIDTSNLLSVNGNVNNTSPTLTGTLTELRVDENGKGFKLYIYYSREGMAAYTTGSELEVNGERCTYDFDKGNSNVIIARRDETVGGFIEGTLSIYYKDSKNSPHTLLCNFRVKRIE